MNEIHFPEPPPKFTHDAFAKACREFSTAYRNLRNLPTHARQTENDRKRNEFLADTMRQVLTHYGSTFRISQEEHSFPTDDSGTNWKPTIIETIYIDWEHYTFVFSVDLGK